MRRSTPFVLVALALLPACDSGGGIAGPQRPFMFGGPAASAAASPVVGTWSRQIVFLDELGAPRASETVWTFKSDGSAVRSVITRNASAGIVDRQDTFARWSLAGDQLVIDFVAPITGRVQLTYVREGDRLILGGQTYVLVP